MNYYITGIKKQNNKIKSIICFDSKIDEYILTPNKWYTIPIDLFLIFMKYKSAPGYCIVNFKEGKWFKGEYLKSSNDLENLLIVNDLNLHDKKTIKQRVKNYFQKIWGNIKNKQNHFIQAQLIGRYWFDPLEHFTQEQIDKPRKRKVILLSRKTKGNKSFYINKSAAEKIMKFEDYELNTIVETLVGTSRIEKRGIQTLIDFENKKTSTVQDSKFLKEYAVLHFVRSKKMFNLTNKNVYKFNKEVLFGRKKRLNSIKNHNLFILAISDMQFFLTENIVIRFEKEEMLSFKNHLYNNLNTFLPIMLKEFIKDQSQFEIYKISKEINSIYLMSYPMNGVLYTPYNIFSIILISKIIENFVNYFYLSIFFIYHPTQFAYLTPHSTSPRGGFTIAALGDFLIKYMLKNNGKFIILKDRSKQTIIEKYIKNSKIIMDNIN